MYLREAGAKGGCLVSTETFGGHLFYWGENMSVDKPFLTIDEQVELLRSRGMSVDGNGRLLLMREGYYSLVNGYKGAFIDRQRTSEAGEDRYREGTTLDHLWTLFDLDRELRELTFPVLVRAEKNSATNRQRLKKRDVEVVPVAESIPEGPEGIVLEALLEGMAEY